MGLSYMNLADIQGLSTALLKLCWTSDEQALKQMEILGIEDEAEALQDFVDACALELERRENQEN
jgi:hypothetical protein